MTTPRNAIFTCTLFNAPECLVGRFNTMLAVIAVALGCCAITTGQQPEKFTQLKIADRYAQKSLGPRLITEKGAPVFEELTEGEIKEITNQNKVPRTNLSADKSKVKSILDSNSDSNNPLIGEFFDGFVFPEMTQLDYEKISNLGAQRNEFFRDYLSNKSTGQSRNQFIESVVLPGMKKIYDNDQLHPAARLNAVYVIGLLDSEAANRATNQNPIPSQSALDELLKIYSAEPTPAFLKVGALAGIQRHVEVDAAVGGQLSDDKRKAIAQQANNVLDNTAAGQASWEAELNYWLKRRAVQMLGLLKSAESLDRLLAVLQSANDGLWLRFDALEAIGRLDLTGVSPEKISQTTLAVANFVATGLDLEAKKIDQGLTDLVFDNMLFQDLDLETAGTDWTSKKPLGGGGGGRGTGRGGMGDPGEGAGLGMQDLGGAGLGGLGGEGGEGGERGESGEGGEGELGGLGGIGGRGGSGAGGGRGGVAAQPAAKKGIVELPNYQLNVSRRRIKALAFAGKKVLKLESKGLHTAADEATKKLIDGIVLDLNQLLIDSNIGIKDLDIVEAKKEENPIEKSKDEVETKSISKQLAEMCDQTAAKLQKQIALSKGEENANPLADPATENPQSPAAVPGADGANNSDGPNLGN